MAVITPQIRNCIIDNKLLQLSNETIPLNAISSISVSHNPPVLSFLGVMAGILITVVSVTEGSFVFTVIGLSILLWSAIKGRNPKFFMLINLHSGRNIRMDIGNRQQAVQAQADLQNALLNNPFIDSAATVSAQPVSQQVRLGN